MQVENKRCLLVSIHRLATGQPVRAYPQALISESLRDGHRLVDPVPPAPKTVVLCTMCVQIRNRLQAGKIKTRAMSVR